MTNEADQIVNNEETAVESGYYTDTPYETYRTEEIVVDNSYAREALNHRSSLTDETLIHGYQCLPQHFPTGGAFLIINSLYIL